MHHCTKLSFQKCHKNMVNFIWFVWSTIQKLHRIIHVHALLITVNCITDNIPVTVLGNTMSIKNPTLVILMEMWHHRLCVPIINRDATIIWNYAAGTFSCLEMLRVAQRIQRLPIRVLLRCLWSRRRMYKNNAVALCNVCHMRMFALAECFRSMRDHDDKTACNSLDNEIEQKSPMLITMQGIKKIHKCVHGRPRTVYNYSLPFLFKGCRILQSKSWTMKCTTGSQNVVGYAQSSPGSLYPPT